MPYIYLTIYSLVWFFICRINTKLVDCLKTIKCMYQLQPISTICYMYHNKIIKRKTNIQQRHISSTFQSEHRRNRGKMDTSKIYT